MYSRQIGTIIRTSAKLLNQDFDGASIITYEDDKTTYRENEIAEFRKDITEAAGLSRIIYLEHTLSVSDFESFLQEVHIPIVVFSKKDDGLAPIILYKKKHSLYMIQFDPEQSEHVKIHGNALPELYSTTEDMIVFLGVFSYKSLVSEDVDSENPQKLTPTKRLLRLLSEERKDIFYVYVYAVLIGLISLTLPLGIQAIISLISGGVFFSSVYVLIAFVIFGVLAAGGLQVMQISLVEFLQRRVFTKAAFEFAFRVPRIKGEALQQYYAPELMNRFFDVLTIQKGLPKLLIDLSAGIIQIIFGLLLLSFYHPFFVFFGLFLVIMLVIIFYLTGPEGLNSSIKESKFKYKVVYWLEEIARTINSFKLSGNTSLPLKKTDTNVNNYLKYRRSHFKVLINQYVFIIIFKAMVTGGLLIIGTVLVVQREITLGQFVASEVIIILTLNSVEKIIMYMDVVYDMLTAVDKIAQVTDLPLEKSGGYTLKNPEGKGFSMKVKNLNYKFPGNTNYTLKDINLEIESGEHICVCGPGGAGKTVLLSTLSGLNANYEGIITVDAYSLRDLDLNNLRDKIGKNVSQEDIFEGTIIENILLAKPQSDPADAIEALQLLGISDEINALPKGLNTPMLSGGKGLSNTLINKIILARCLVKKPRMLVLNDFFNDFSKSDRQQIINILTHAEIKWTLLVTSNDPIIMQACQRVIIMEQGALGKSGTYEELQKSGALNFLIESI